MRISNVRVIDIEVDDHNAFICHQDCPYNEDGKCKLYGKEIEKNFRLDECIEELGLS